MRDGDFLPVNDAAVVLVPVMVIVLMLAGGVFGAESGAADSLVPIATASNSAAEDGTLFLSRANLTEVVENPKQNVVVLVCAAWSGLCKSFRPTWDRLQKRRRFAESGIADVVFAEVNVDSDPKLGEELKIHGLPTIRFYAKGLQKTPKEYVGSRDFADVLRFLKEHRR